MYCLPPKVVRFPDKLNDSNVPATGVDEIHVGHGQANRAFLMIERNPERGADIHFGNGKDVSAMEGALSRLNASRLQVAAPPGFVSSPSREKNELA